jgi:hypothetical protein
VSDRCRRIGLARRRPCHRGRIAPHATPATVDIDPHLRSVFVDAVARACDIVDLSPEQICEAFALVAVEGLDHPLVERPINIKISQSRSAPEQLYAFDRKIPHRVPAIVLPIDEPDDVPLGNRFR